MYTPPAPPTTTPWLLALPTLRFLIVRGYATEGPTNPAASHDGANNGRNARYAWHDWHAPQGHEPHVTNVPSQACRAQLVTTLWFQQIQPKIALCSRARRPLQAATTVNHPYPSHYRSLPLLLRNLLRPDLVGHEQAHHAPRSQAGRPIRRRFRNPQMVGSGKGP